jgi:AraC-like DNA-binding protein
MVDSGQQDIRSVEFHSSSRPGIPVEVLQRADLLARFEPTHFDRPQRPTFDSMMLARSGTGIHTIDFETIPVRPGRLIRVRPGQVQTLDTSTDIDATIVIARTEPRAGSTWFPGHSAYCDLGPNSLRTAEALVAALSNEQDRFTDDEPSSRLLLSLYAALAALFDRAQQPLAAAKAADPYTAYRAALEADLGKSHNVRDFAADLGYAERTISRACQQATGLTAKGVLNQRLVLEAKRLLAHTDKTAAAISAELGFSEPTNFHKFFARQTNQRPSEFRAANRPVG